jgi:hypothetical protein
MLVGVATYIAGRYIHVGIPDMSVAALRNCKGIIFVLGKFILISVDREYITLRLSIHARFVLSK